MKASHYSRTPIRGSAKPWESLLQAITWHCSQRGPEIPKWALGPKSTKQANVATNYYAGVMRELTGTTWNGLGLLAGPFLEWWAPAAPRPPPCLTIDPPMTQMDSSYLCKGLRPVKRPLHGQLGQTQPQTRTHIDRSLKFSGDFRKFMCVDMIHLYGSSLVNRFLCNTSLL